MKDYVSREQFHLRQPDYPGESPTDDFYFRLTNHLAGIIADEHLLPKWPEILYGRVALTLTGYLQDILTDSGIWRAFITECERLYGKWLPFYPLPDDYIPHELNEADVRFLVWYALCMNYEERRVENPCDPEITKASERLHAELDRYYEDESTPVPENFFIWRGLDLKDPSEADEVFRFGHWLFMHSYLMTPAYSLTLSEIMSNPELKEGKNLELLRHTLEESMMEDPTGPLALYLQEWICLIIEGKLPRVSSRKEEPKGDHPYFTKFMEASGGTPIKFFRTYDELNEFFVNSLGWGEGEHLPALKDSKDFVLLVNREKGMLCAANVAACINLPENPCYDPEYARRHAIDLYTQRGLCPADLLHYLMGREALPDARFPGTDDNMLVKENGDFIARCYLQKYYRGD